MDTRLIRTPRNYEQFCLSRRKAYISSIKLTRLLRTFVNTDNGHFSVSPVKNREYWVRRCTYGFHSLNLVRLQLQLQMKLNNGLVLLKFPLHRLYKFLQKYDKWLLG